MKLIKDNEVSRRANVLKNVLKTYTGTNSIEQYQRKKNITVDGLAGLQTWNALYNDLLDVVDYTAHFKNYYYSFNSAKKQIVWHHSAGWDNARGMFDYWKNDNVNHVATAIGIEDDGKVYKGFDEGLWAHHIGMRNQYNQIRNIESVAVEVCNWGALTEKAGKLYSWSGALVDKSKVIELDYKGIKYYEEYTDKEMESLKRWTLLCSIRFDIALAYSHDDMWNLSWEAIQGKAGVFTHNSFIEWKTDVSPQPKLISMAKELSDFEK